MLASLMGSSILSEVHETPSILGTELFSASAILDYRSLGSCSRAAGWSAATLCFGTERTCRGRLTMSGPESKTDVPREPRTLPFLIQAVFTRPGPRSGVAQVNARPNRENRGLGETDAERASELLRCLG